MSAVQDVTSGSLAPARRHIIRRPRLERLLGDSTSRVVMLVAPAGYGKTTLARQWLEDKPHAWYQARSASADVAALAVGLARAPVVGLDELSGDVEKRVRATNEPEADVPVFAELLAEDVKRWPSAAWLVIDDYHLLAQSEAAERLIELVIEQTDVRVLITSRRRPSWASARRILYGEILEIGKHALALNAQETDEIVAAVGGQSMTGLYTLAEGWPAMIGLAALAPVGHGAAPDELPDSLYEYFAEELLHAASNEVRDFLCQLALLPVITNDLIADLAPPPADELLSEATRLGFVNTAGGVIEIHPLTREFLIAHFRRSGEPFERAKQIALRALIRHRRWDEAFDLIEQFEIASMLDELLRSCLNDLLRAGRRPTLERWLAHAARRRVHTPMLVIARAALAFRRGQFAKARALAEEALRSLEPIDRARVPAHLEAGQAAFFSGQADSALHHFELTANAATESEELGRALFGQLSAASEHDTTMGLHLLPRLEELLDDRPETLLRQLTATWMVWNRRGEIGHLTEPMRSAGHLADEVDDPMVKTSFQNALANQLVLSGCYAEALDVVAAECDVLHKYRLDFALPHAYVNAATAHIGLRQFSEASALLARMEGANASAPDLHIALNALALRARLFLAEGSPSKALSALSADWDGTPTPGMYGEFIATRALILAALNETEHALELVDEVEAITTAVEAAALSALARHIACLNRGAESGSVVSAVLETVDRTGNVDALVVAYRASPQLLRAVRSDRHGSARLARVASRASDYELLGTRPHRAPGRQPLSPRETEVYQLLLRGLTNREIARSLFISEATVKVHVRRILEKFGVRTRTEAALLN